MTKVIRYENGMKLIYERDKEIEGVAVDFYFKAGSLNDPKGKQGLAHLTEHCLCSLSNKIYDRKFLTDNLIQKYYYKNAKTNNTLLAFDTICNKSQFEECLEEMTACFTGFVKPEEFEEEKKIVFIVYLAISRNSRNSGYGSQMIKEIIDYFKNNQYIIIEVEADDGNKDEKSVSIVVKIKATQNRE